MSEPARKASGSSGSVTWGTLFGRAGLVGVVSFVVLQTKEFVDAGRLDTPGTGADAVMIAGGTLLVYALLKLLK